MAITSRGIRGWLYKELAMPMPVQALGSLILTVQDSDVADGQSEKIDWLGFIPGFAEWKDKRQESQPVDYNLTVLAKKFEDSFQIPTKWTRNDKVAQVQKSVAQFAARVPDLWNDLVAQQINANGNAFDGVAYFSASHVWGASGTFSNLYAATGTAVPAAPTPAEAAKAIMGAYQTMLGYKDDRGRPLPAPTVIKVVCPTATFAAFYQAVTMNFLSTGTTQIDNPVLGLAKGMGLTFEVITSPLLTAAGTTAYLFNASPASANPFVGFENPAERRYSQKAEGSDFEHDKDAWAFGLTIVGNVGLGHFVDACRITFS